LESEIQIIQLEFDMGYEVGVEHFMVQNPRRKYIYQSKDLTAENKQHQMLGNIIRYGSVSTLPSKQSAATYLLQRQQQIE
jgi:hypothetical protein